MEDLLSLIRYFGKFALCGVGVSLTHAGLDRHQARTIKSHFICAPVPIYRLTFVDCGFVSSFYRSRT